MPHVVHYRGTPSIKFASTHFCNWVERSMGAGEGKKESCLGIQHNDARVVRYCRPDSSCIPLPYIGKPEVYLLIFDLVFWCMYYSVSCTSRSGWDIGSETILCKLRLNQQNVREENQRNVARKQQKFTQDRTHKWESKRTNESFWSTCNLTKFHQIRQYFFVQMYPRYRYMYQLDFTFHSYAQRYPFNIARLLVFSSNDLADSTVQPFKLFICGLWLTV